MWPIPGVVPKPPQTIQCNGSTARSEVNYGRAFTASHTSCVTGAHSGDANDEVSAHYLILCPQDRTDGSEGVTGEVESLIVVWGGRAETFSKGTAEQDSSLGSAVDARRRVLCGVGPCSGTSPGNMRTLKSSVPSSEKPSRSFVAGQGSEANNYRVGGMSEPGGSAYHPPL